jgi:hypothetical protein
MYQHPVLPIGDVYPGSEFFHPGSRIQSQKIPGPLSGPTSKNLSIFIAKNCFYILEIVEIRSGMFIQDPDLDFLLIPDPGVKKAPDPVGNTASTTVFH